MIDSALRRWRRFLLGWPSSSPVGAVLFELGWPFALHLSTSRLLSQFGRPARHAFPWPVSSPRTRVPRIIDGARVLAIPLR